MLRMSMIDNARDLAKLLQQVDNVEIQKKLVQTQNDFMELHQENLDLKNRVKALEEQLKLNETLVFRPPFYYVEGDETPYCAKCWEVDKTLVHSIYSHTSVKGELWICPNCEVKSTMPGTKPPKKPESRVSSYGRRSKFDGQW